MVNQKWLATFMMLVKTGHFTHAAEKMHMTQPGVSQHIKKLEEQLKTTLINRYGKQFELSLAGEKLYQYGQQMLALEEQLHQAIEQDDPLQGECRFSCSGTLAMHLYPHFLTYQCKHSGLNVSVEAAPNQNIIDDLLENKIDIGIVTQQVYSDELVQYQVGQETLQLVLPIQYKNAEIDFTFLNTLGFINHPDGFYYLDKVLKANDFNSYRGRDSLNIKSYINQLSQILLPVSQGVGFTVLPARAIAQFEPQQSLYAAPLTHNVTEKLYLTKKRYRQLPARYEWFEETICQLLKL
ncbi:LysR family transcriptional regulator [Photobacterium sp.]|uniref:LysR family transcriptional regulator n=1 Tax=Photobacterium sp. TaxID=660 RepID=UPI00299D8FD7|nr:LysR family transcriptional regulator [Photobacterium sp.]MDX1301408.1 LysR family transcriptional regulator [Photobacterium sp.]